MVKVERLRCEDLVDPLGVDVPAPRLGWWVVSDRRGAAQSAYQVQVATSPELLEAAPDLWDSGRVEAVDPCHVAYGGRTLVSRQRCCWRVRVWDEDDLVSGWSQVATWETGLLDPADWSATWVSDPERPEGGRPSYLRRELELPSAPVRARAYVTAHGLYELRLNGRRVSDDLLRPGWTDYTSRTTYQVLDVTGHLHEGPNALAAVLADGWYAGQVAWVPRHLYGPQPWFLLQLEVELADGSVLRQETDGSWWCGDGPLLAADIVGGERYDARLAADGWDRPGWCAPASWRSVRTGHATSTRLTCQRGPSVRALQEISPRSVHRTPSGALVYDLGQNFSGFARLTAELPAGTAVRLVFGEMLGEDGEVYRDNLRGAEASDEYVFAGTGFETWQPFFTYHGFRYVGLLGEDLDLGLDAVTGVVVHSDTPATGSFRCSVPLLDQLQSNIVWGQRSNFVEVPTDCPQRDERLGWMGDAQIFASTAAFNMDVSAFFTKWFDDVLDAQDARGGAFPDIAPEIHREFNGKAWPDGAPGWADAGVIVPFTLLLHYGDERIVRDNLGRFATWLERVRAANPDLVWRAAMNNNYGDWLSVGETTPKELVATSYFFHSADLVARMARYVGAQDVARTHEQLREGIRAAYLAAFVEPDGRIAGDTQTAYVLALRFGIAQGSVRNQVVGHLVRRLAERAGRLSTGFLGVGHVMHALVDAGLLDEAFAVLQSTDFPSWGYSISHGATTMWERWDGWTEHAGFQDPHMNSFNHYAFGAVGQWMYAHVGGIAPVEDAPGFRRVRVAPLPGRGIRSAAASLDTVRGRVAVSWELVDDVLQLELEVPPTSVADVHLPSRGTTEGGRPLASAPGVVVLADDRFEVAAGSYRFLVPWGPS